MAVTTNLVPMLFQHIKHPHLHILVEAEGACEGCLEQVPQPLRSENPRAQMARVILSMHKQSPFTQYTVPFLVHRTGSVVGDRYVYTHPA